MFPAQAYGQRTAALAPGDVLCLYTDGIVESRKEEQEEYGEGRLERRVRELAASPAREIMERVFEDVFGFSGCTEAGDDMTLVVVKRKP
jgi:sigma-B regulation protein RsbU (phosphoserine phosphatase)